ncbi:MAG: hypothetical protein IVW55_03775 [Chloroflexi bacterium]|nr:hypothetical protein [Chloroflexota bacterium]
MENQSIKAAQQPWSSCWFLRSRRLLSLFALIGLIYALRSGLVYAAGSADDLTGSRYSSPFGLIVDVQSVRANFPDNIDFSLQARGFEAQRAALNYSLVGEAVTSDVQASIARPASDLSLNVTIDLGTDYIPLGAQVTYYWTLTSTDGLSVDTAARTFTLVDGRYRWQSLADAQRRVSVHWYEGDQAFGKELLAVASSTLDRLQSEIQAALKRPADIWVYPTQSDLLDALPRNIPEWVGGKAFPELSLVISAIADDSDADTEIKRVVPHELSHLALYQATLNPYNSPPAWLDEGLAMRNQQSSDPQEAASLKKAAEEGSLVPLKALSGSFGADEKTALLSYAESRSAVDFILTDDRYGPQKFARTIAAFHNGVTYDEALQLGLGITVDELDKEWRTSLPYKIGSLSPAAQLSAPQSSGVAGLFTGMLSNAIVAVAVAVFVALSLVAGILAAIMVRHHSARGKL